MLSEEYRVYGDALREWSNELRGDGTLSAMDCTVTLAKRGERGVITINAQPLSAAKEHGGAVVSERPGTQEFERFVSAALPSVVREVAAAENGHVYRSVMARVELPLLRQALELSGGNQLKAARLLGINRNTLRKRLRLLGVLAAPSGDGEKPA